MKSNTILSQLVTRFLMVSLALSILLTQTAVEAEVTVIPVWNATRNRTGSELCMSIVDDGVINVIGDETQSCSVQLIASNGTAALIQIPPRVSLYVERQEDIPLCQKRYVSFTTDVYCVYVLHQHVKIFLQGYPDNRSIFISGIHLNTSMPMCMDDEDDERHVSRVSQTNHCHAEEFNLLISCNPSFDFTCTFEFPSNCNATLNRRDVEFHCYDEYIYSSYKALIAHYPANIVTLDLTKRNIIEICENSFTDLKSLKRLILDYNSLSYLSPHVFKDLKSLNYLSLRGNHFMTFEVDLFRHLNSLEILILARNRLNTLPIGIFHGLINLTKLYLDHNKLTALHQDLFAELKNLSVLSVYNNSLKDLPENIFSTLVNLLVLDLDDNNLVTLANNLFKSLQNLTTLYLERNNLKVIPEELFRSLGNLKTLVLGMNEINSLEEILFHENGKLFYLRMWFNNLKHLPQNLFHGLYDLNLLYLYGNQLLSLPDDIFRGLKNLKTLSLSYNNISYINGQVFNDLTNLQVLYMAQNHLKSLDLLLFQYTINLRVLDLSGNEFTSLPNVSNLYHLIFLNLKDNKMSKATKKTFLELPSTTELIVSQPELCECYVSINNSCTARNVRSPYMTCDRLLSDRVLVVMMWLIGLNAVGGNIYVLSRRKTKKDKKKIQTFLLGNLAMSDLLMGIYMLLIASADIYFAEDFPLRAEVWRSGITCRIAGTIAILSSEASVFFVTMISIDRFISVKYPYSSSKYKKQSSTVIAIVLWLISLALGVIPSSLAGTNIKFYDNSHVCIGLPLAKPPIYTNRETVARVCPEGTDICFYKRTFTSQHVGQVSGMYFSSAMFLGLNSICYLTIVLCYMEIVRTVFKSAKRAGLNSEIKEQIRMTSKVAAVVLTDFFCWFPVIVLGILVQADALTLPPSVYAWCVTFVLPINSAINPYLYTIAAVISNRRKQAQISPSENQSSASRWQRSQTQNTDLQVVSTTQQSNIDIGYSREKGTLPSKSGLSLLAESHNDSDHSRGKGTLPSTSELFHLAESNL